MSTAMVEGSVDWPDGADPSPILALAHSFERAQRRLIGAQTQVEDAVAIAESGWDGDAEANFAGHCRHDLAQFESAARHCATVAVVLRNCAAAVTRFQADYQQAAAKERWVRDMFDNMVGDAAEDLYIRWRGYIDEQRGAVDGVRECADACQGQLTRLATQFDALFTDIETPTSPTRPGALVILAPPASSGLAFLQESTELTDNDGAIPVDAIQVQLLSDGSYAVILPGVRDLSNLGFIREPFGIGEHANSARKVKHTAPMATVDGTNLYAQRVMEALQAAGVPAGSRVRFIGHSAGGYAAVSIASNPRYNATTSNGSYSVNVVDVVSLAASNEWKAPQMPRRTNLLLVNNRQDLVVQAEDVATPSTPWRPRDWNREWNPRVTLVENRPNQVMVRVNGGSITSSGHWPETYRDALPNLGSEANQRISEFDGLYVVRRTNVQVPETVPPSGPWVRNVPVTPRR
jgi:hypothetical protein